MTIVVPLTSLARELTILMWVSHRNGDIHESVRSSAEDRGSKCFSHKANPSDGDPCYTVSTHWHRLGWNNHSCHRHHYRCRFGSPRSLVPSPALGYPIHLLLLSKDRLLQVLIQRHQECSSIAALSWSISPRSKVNSPLNNFMASQIMSCMLVERPSTLSLCAQTSLPSSSTP
ncbi:unnamed protein product [Citrullus colocynthis]|uniref:Uncharacterized protein n=1 Tax=Citrullus colocynthis TaxID=252529 RepID=A0ABP0Z0J0_9ROSI